MGGSDGRAGRHAGLDAETEFFAPVEYAASTAPHSGPAVYIISFVLEEDGLYQIEVCEQYAQADPSTADQIDGEFDGDSDQLLVSHDFFLRIYRRQK